MGRGGAPAREISFVSLVAYGPEAFLLSLSHGGLQLLKPGGAVPNMFRYTNTYHCVTVAYSNVLYRFVAQEQ